MKELYGRRRRDGGDGNRENKRGQGSGIFFDALRVPTESVREALRRLDRVENLIDDVGHHIGNSRLAEEAKIDQWLSEDNESPFRKDIAKRQKEDILSLSVRQV